jgi:hypothetical protein
MLASKYIRAGSLVPAAFIFLSASLCISLGLPLAAAAGPAPKPPTAKVRTLTFPDREVVAHLDLVIPRVDAKGHPSAITRRVIALGKIEVPDNAIINIKLMYDGLEHLQTLAQLNPGQVGQLNAASLDLDDAQFAFFKRFPGIYRINLDSTMITDKSMSTFATFKGLFDLRISKVALTGAGFEALNGMPLLTLNLDGSDVREGALAKIKSLPERLTGLNCAKTRIGPADMPFIAKCQKLTSLDFNGDKQITDACVKDIIKLKMLDNLNLTDTSITEKSLPALATMPHLKQLVVRSSKFWTLGHGKSPRSTLTISDAVTVSRTPIDVFTPLH